MWRLLRGCGGGEFASVVMPAHNHLQDLSRPCIDSVLLHTRYPYQLILIDDGSADGSSQYFRTVTEDAYRLSRRSGPAAARNLALLHSRGDPIVFLDNDMIVPQGWLTILAEECKKPGVGIVAAVPSNEMERLRTQPSADMLLEFPCVSGAGMAVTRQCFNAVGYFDESLMNCGEDTDFCYRALERGFRVANTPRLIIEHHAGGTRRGLDKREMERAARRFREKYIKHQHTLPMPPLYPFG